MKNINLQPKIEDIFNMIRITNFKSCILLLAVLFTFSFQSLAQPDGAQIFKANCTACHTIGGGRLVGPDLEGVTKKRKADWLKLWINSSSELIASGDADAIAIFEEYNKSAMTDFYFEDEEMEVAIIDKKLDNLIGVLDWDIKSTEQKNTFNNLFDIE